MASVAVVGPGRPTEHDAIHGAALRRADVLGIDTPTIRIIHGLLDARSPVRTLA